MPNSNARAFLIGDANGGLTIVVTDPVMIYHYSAEDLKDDTYNDRHDEDPDFVRGAVVRSLLPHLRGVDVPRMEAEIVRIESGNSPLSRNEQRAIWREVDLADTAGQIATKEKGVFGVDFCISIPFTTTQVVDRPRVGQPATSIGDYLDTYGRSGVTQVPAQAGKERITRLDLSGLRIPPPWSVDE